MSIDRTTRIARMMEVIRADRKAQKNTSEASKQLSTAPVDDLQLKSLLHLKTSLKNIFQEQELKGLTDRESAKKQVLKAVLAHQLGEGIASEPEFIRICEQMHDKINRSNELRSYFDGLIEKILSH